MEFENPKEREKYILANKGLVISYINRHIPNLKLQDWEDIVGVGDLALCQAVDSYDPKKGSFGTYFYSTFRMLYAKYGTGTSLVKTTPIQKEKASKNLRDLRFIFRDASLEQIAKYLGFEVSVLEEIEAMFPFEEVKFTDLERENTVGETVKCWEKLTDNQTPEQSLLKKETLTELKERIDSFDEVTKLILYYNVYCGMSLNETAGSLKMVRHDVAEKLKKQNIHYVRTRVLYRSKKTGGQISRFNRVCAQFFKNGKITREEEENGL